MVKLTIAKRFFLIQKLKNMLEITTDPQQKEIIRKELMKQIDDQLNNY
jgi:hypothetical protein